ncbi:hypothetical protein SAMN04487950_1917 [Halogranum rubrum]|uniref:Uncharacterized protein n=1 Tax=Halogranum rubrum TaxID=553466 RepID=A0A1I4E529_9EURY|nr:hypothetical protein [Halogranum rubrum]SFL00934.1 hypothetical protein SAMN04487950_1917 [Halogranum rubrum]
MDSRLRSLALLVGVLLVTVPLYAPLFDVTGVDYQYEATELTVDDDGLTLVNDAPRNVHWRHGERTKNHGASVPLVQYVSRP